MSFPTQPREDTVASIVVEVGELFSAIENAYPNDSDALDVVARFHFLLGNHDTAENLWQRGIKKNAQDPYCLHGLGLVQQTRNDYESAQTNFRQATEFNPDDPTVRRHLANALLILGRMDEAIAVSIDCLKLANDSSETWTLLGNVYLADQQYQAAKEAFLKSLEFDPSDYIAQQGLAQSLIRLGDRHAAATLLKQQAEQRTKANKVDGDHDEIDRRKISHHLTLAANLLLKHGETETAIRTLQYASACASDDSIPKQQLVIVYQKLNRLEEAIAVANKIIEQEPDTAAFRIGLADLYLRANKRHLAEQTIVNAVKHTPENPELYEQLVRMLLQNQGNIPRLLEAAKKLTDLRGSSSDHALRAQALFQTGNLTESIASLQKAIELDPENASYRQILAQIQRGPNLP